ncbi:MAG: aminodeoxychorismate synthase component I [Polyangiaceae bacterium]
MPAPTLPRDFDLSRPFALLENSRAGREEPASLLFWAPSRHIIAKGTGDLDTLMGELDRARADGYFSCGYLTYEAGYCLVDKRAFAFSHVARSDLPLASFFCFSRYDRLDRAGVDAFLDAADSEAAGGDGCVVHDLNLTEDYATYSANVERIHGYIRDGDTYQVNHTFKARFSFTGSRVSLFRSLRERQSVEFGAFLAFPEARIVSLSPELFVRKAGTTITTRPMKGTAARGATLGEDEVIRAALREDPKTRSENLMIVDLIRSDVGRIADIGSVSVRDLFEVQTFETIHQMVSTVEGRVARDFPVADTLRHLFPCGSITGAPKIRAMEIIEQLEAEPRGVYSGAIGYVAPNSDYCFSVPIRTVVSVAEGRGELGIGSAIIAESSARGEFDECLLKSRFLTDVNSSFHLIESMRLAPGGSRPDRFELHLARLCASARCFGFPFDRARVESSIGEALAACLEIPPAARKVRVLLFHDGRVEASVGAIPDDAGDRAGAHDPTAQSRRLTFCHERIRSRSIVSHHKTSLRAHFERAFATAASQGAYDAILLNERGEVVEASRHNLFVEKDGVLVTPPLASGALPGVYRGTVLSNARGSTLPAREAVLFPADVVSADRVFLTNSVRGMVEVRSPPPWTDDPPATRASVTRER